MPPALRAYLGNPRRLLAIAALAASVGATAFFRVIDGDEGFFLMAARLVSDGLRPYHDFFFIHAPMVPYAFGAWFKVATPGWYTARALAGLIAMGTGLLVFDHLRRVTGKDRWGLLGVALYIGSGLVLGWF